MRTLFDKESNNFMLSYSMKMFRHRRSLLVKKFICLRQRRSRILRGRSRAGRPQDRARMQGQPKNKAGMKQIGNRTNKE